MKCFLTFASGPSRMNQLSTILNPSASENGRSSAPVFVLGCPRSGTTVLYHMLLSAGDFAVYRAESNVFNLLVPRFGDLRVRRNKKQLMEHWLKSKLFRVSGLEPAATESKIWTKCESGGDFLRIVMEAIAQKQGVRRWAECTPDHLLYMAEIKLQIRDALFIHIIRDGRDVALSYAKQGWSSPLPWDRHQDLAVAALYWRWIVRDGRRQSRGLGVDYMEVRFEDLITRPREVLSKIGEFVGKDLDYDRIQQVGLGSVSAPNSSFLEDSDNAFSPIGRWKSKLNSKDLLMLEVLIGDLLETSDTLSLLQIKLQRWKWSE